jgi:DNA repair exonuclease SbcCD ATPase subunit
MKIKQIKFNSFRAYKSEIFDIPPDKNIILIYGRNGFGKTSLFDGIEWSLTGKLRRYEGVAREKNEYPVLRHSSSEINEKDGVEILFDSGKKLSRYIKTDNKNDYGSGKLEFNNCIIDNLNEWIVEENFRGEIDFDTSFNFTQLLSQELISDFVRHTKDSERYRTVVDLFGLNSFKNFDKHINNIKNYISTRIENISSDIYEASHEIELEEAKLVTLDIEPAIKTRELENLYKSEIEASELGVIRTKFEKNLVNSKKNLVSTNKNIENLNFLKLNFIEKEKLNKEYDIDLIQYNLLRDLVEKLPKKTYFNNIDKFLESYNKYIELEKSIKDVKQKLYDLNEVAKSHDFFKKNLSNDNQINALGSYDNEFTNRVSQYFNLKKTNSNQEDLLKRQEQELKRISGVKKELLYIAKKFLEDEQNKNLETCPVCENEFNITETLIQISNMLGENNNLEFDGIIHAIRSIKVDVIENVKFLKNEENELLQHVHETKDKYRKDYIKLLEQDKVNKKYVDSYNYVNQNLNSLNIKFASYDTTRHEYFEVLDKYEFYKKDLPTEYYNRLLNEKHKKLENDYKEITSYRALKSQYQIENFDNINTQLEKGQTKSNNMKIYLDSSTRAIKLSSELITYHDNDALKTKIDTIKNQLKLKQKNKVKLEKIQNDYWNLKVAIKSSLDDETKIQLGSHQQLIEKFYGYLNPSIYMRNLTIKKTNNNANRLVFEVSGEDSSKKHSPSYIFSTAQNNILALSIFLSFAIKQKWSLLDSIFLDDPIQNMDDINVHSFVDLLRLVQSKTNKQIFISTHDEKIYKFMLNKFGEDNVHSFKLKDYGVLETKS